MAFLGPPPPYQEPHLPSFCALQTMYYLADPETGKKVVEQGGRFWCEGESK